MIKSDVPVGRLMMSKHFKCARIGQPTMNYCNGKVILSYILLTTYPTLSDYKNVIA